MAQYQAGCKFPPGTQHPDKSRKRKFEANQLITEKNMLRLSGQTSSQKKNQVLQRAKI